MILYIDTTSNDFSQLAIIYRKKIVKYKKFKVNFRHAEVLLVEIDKLLKTSRITLKDIKTIMVANGRGGFTAIRIGVTIANTLAWLLRVPVVALAGNEKLKNIDNFRDFAMQNIGRGVKNKYVAPSYSAEPNITKCK